MSGYLVFDTESSGLFVFKDKDGKPVPADAPGQPRLASVSMLFVGADMKLEREYHQLVKPDGWTMEPGATAVNGLTDAFLAERGTDVRRALEQWTKAIVEDGRTVVAHNCQFDAKMMRGELRRAGLPDLFEQTKQICTMRALTDVCKIPPKSGRGGYKWPALSEACVFFGFDQFGDHSAKNDAMACYMLLRKLAELGLLREGAVHYAKEKSAPRDAGKNQSLRAGLQASAATVANDDAEDF